MRGHVHTNGIENFWGGLKRTLTGTYIYTSVQHLERYLDEQTFRFNNKDKSDAARTYATLKQSEGRRIMYKDLTLTVNEKQAILKEKQRAAQLRRPAAKT